MPPKQPEGESILFKLLDRGLIVSEEHEQYGILIARPASVSGTVFPGYDKPRQTGIDPVYFNTNAPLARITRKRRPIRWHVDISVPMAPGPGPVFFAETFHSFDEAAEAVIDCFFGDRIDFGDRSLARWYGTPFFEGDGGEEPRD